jgi:hypothetical protein
MGVYYVAYIFMDSRSAAPDVHEQRQIKADARGLLQVKIARHDRQRITYAHRAFAAFNRQTQNSIMDEMNTECRKGHNISQLAARLSTWAIMHIVNKAEPDYSLGFTVSKDIQFDAHGDIIVPAHVKPLLFRTPDRSDDEEEIVITPTGNRHEQCCMADFWVTGRVRNPLNASIATFCAAGVTIVCTKPRQEWHGGSLGSALGSDFPTISTGSHSEFDPLVRLAPLFVLGAPFIGL